MQPRAYQPRNMKSIDGFFAPVSPRREYYPTRTKYIEHIAPQPVAAQPVQPPPAPTANPLADAFPAKKKRLPWIYVPISLGVLGAGVLLPNIQYGQWLIAAYALIALIFRLKSQVTFSIALFALATIPILMLTNNQPLAENYAVYSFLLLVIGLVSASVELAFSHS